MRNKPSVPYEYVMNKYLKDPKWAAGYLSESIKQGDWDAFLIALRRVADVRGGGLSKVARSAKLSREHLYRMLSKHGNPGMKNVMAILQALGYKIELKPDLKKAA